MELAIPDYPADKDTQCADRFKSDNGCKRYGPYLYTMLVMSRIADQSIENADTMCTCRACFVSPRSGDPVGLHYWRCSRYVEKNDGASKGPAREFVGY